MSITIDIGKTVTAAAGTDFSFTCRVFNKVVTGTTEIETARDMTDGTVAIKFKRDVSDVFVDFSGTVSVSDTNLLTIDIAAADTARDSNTSLNENVIYYGDVIQTTGEGKIIFCGRIKLVTKLVTL